MIARVKEAVLVSGTVADVRFTPTRDAAYVDFAVDEGIFTFEFKNGKKQRADHVRKLRLKKGDEATAIGAVSEGSDLYGFGYDLALSGRLEKAGFAALSGVVEKVTPGRSVGIVYVKDDEGRTKQLKCPAGDLSEVSVGDRADALCQSWSTLECAKTCGEASLKRCLGCEKKKKIRRYDAVRVARRD